MAGDVKEITGKDFKDKIEGSDKLVIVEFYLDTCASCQAIAPVYAKLSEEHDLDAVFTKVDVQKDQALAQRFGIMATPTFKFFCKGEPIGGIVGAVNATLLRNTIKDFIRHRQECSSRSSRITYEIDGYG